ncbi:MAG: hypothetical protein B7Z81_04985, partial [Acidocella sp. 20-61-6]
KAAEVEQMFLADPSLPAIMITEAGRVFGIFSRKNMMAAISRPFGRDVFIKRPIRELLNMIDTEPLTLPALTPIAAALKAAMARPPAQMFEPLLVSYERFIGLLEVNVLMTAQANLLELALRSKEQLLHEVERKADQLHETLQEQERLSRALSHAKEVAQYEATHDALTGLPNRRLFLERLEVALQAQRKDGGEDCAVLFIDLDRFKIVNDSLGHLAGNALLVEVARRLQGSLRQSTPLAGTRCPDTVARLSGDEFAVLLTDRIRSTAPMTVATRLQAALSAPFAIGSETAFVSASIGIVPSIAGYDDTEAILRDADIAMYRGKREGKARAVTFEPEMRTQVETRLLIENELREALTRQEFELHYQPVVALKSGEITGLEALVRWHRGGKLAMPDSFIGVAEETGLIVPLGNWVFGRACEAARHWQSVLPRAAPLDIAVNLSALQFRQEDLAETLEDLVHLAGIDAGNLTIEITERSAMENPDRALAMLQRLKARGFRLAIDDFGTGYSSLSYLHRLPIDVLKIDRSFIANFDSRDGGKIVAAILALARSLDITVVAEGVETARQAEQLNALGCDFAQGYFFARPMAQAAVEVLLLPRLAEV